MTPTEFALSLLPMPGPAQPGAWRGMRWALLGAVAAAGFVVGALQRQSPPANPMLNLAFAPGIMFDVQ